MTQKADFVLSSNFVFTGLDKKPIPASIVIKDKRIIAIGKEHEIHKFIDSNTKKYSFENELIMSGFHDYHLHIMLGCILKDSIQLSKCRSEEQVAQSVKEFADNRHDDFWIFGYGWDSAFWDKKNMPHRFTLDRFISDRPVLLFNAEFHYAWVNTKALEILGIDNTTPNPSYGEFQKDINGVLTGLVYENAIDLITRKAFSLPKERRVKIFKNFLTEAAQYGITSVNDLYASLTSTGQIEEIALYHEIEQKGELSLRIHFSPVLSGDLQLPLELQQQYNSGKVQLNGLKQFIDGVITANTAYLLEPYLDNPETKGEITFPAQDLINWVIDADSRGFQVRFHAIGNGAVRLALDAFEKAIVLNGKNNTRHSIEHVEVLSPEDLDRFNKLGVIASMQPKHVGLIERESYLSRVGKDQNPLFFPTNTIMKTGAKVAFGTDYPIAPLNPMLGIYSALTREDGNGLVWKQEECISLADALINYTKNPAYGCKRDHEIGSIEVGKLADIIVLNKNLFDIPVEQIPQTKVILTMVDGEVVFENGI